MKPIRWSEDSRLNIVTTEMQMGVDCIVELDWIGFGLMIKFVGGLGKSKDWVGIRLEGPGAD